MSNISSFLTNGYFSLTGQSSGGSSTPAVTPTLASVLAATDAKSSSADSSYTLDLSEGALAYIQQINASAASNPSTQGFTSDATTSFALSTAEQKTLNDILAKYKDAPFTQDTFDQIQSDMNAAGLTEKTFAAQDAARATNLTQFFLDAINGNGTMAIDNAAGLSNTNSAANDEKMANFMKSVATAWAKISTTVDEATTT